MFSIDALARAYRVPLIDYARPGDRLLISSCSGSMMALMDACPGFRWCLDIDQWTAASRFADFALCLPRLVSLVGVAGWFSITDPRPLRQALEPIAGQVRIVAYVPDPVELPGERCRTMDAFIDAVNAVTSAGV